MTNQPKKIVSEQIGEELLPTSLRLLSATRDTLARVLESTADAYARREIASLDLILSELMLREEPDFYLNHYVSLIRLVDEGVDLLRDRLSASDADLIQRERAALPASLPAGLGYRAIGIQINRALRVIERLFEATRGTSDPSIAAYVNRVMDQEKAFQAHRKQEVRETPPAPAYISFTPERMQEYLRRKFPERRGIRVVRLAHLVGGIQKITAMLDVEDDDGRKESLVLRGERGNRFIALDAGRVADEYEVVKTLYAAGMPVAEPCWLETDLAHFGQCFFVSRKVAGESFGSAIGVDRTPSRDVMRSFIRTMAKIHRMPVTDELRRSALGRWLNYPTLAENTYANVCYWKDQIWMGMANPSPIFKRLTTWLLDNVPKDEEPPRLTHGDYGPHNFLVERGEVSGVLDWEAAHIGDPAEDMSWLLQSCDGHLAMEDALNWYEEFSGWRMSEYRARYYMVFNSLKVMTGALSISPMFENTPSATVELCDIPLRWAPFSTARIEAQILAAEACKQA